MSIVVQEYIHQQESSLSIDTQDMEQGDALMVIKMKKKPAVWLERTQKFADQEMMVDQMRAEVSPEELQKDFVSQKQRYGRFIAMKS